MNTNLVSSGEFNMFKNVYLMPFPSLGWEETKKRLIEIKNINKIEAIIPNLDAELPMYIKYQDELEKMGIKTLLPSLENFEMREKKRLAKFAKNLGVKHPQTKEISSDLGVDSGIIGRHIKALLNVSILQVVPNSIYPC